MPNRSSRYWNWTLYPRRWRLVVPIAAAVALLLAIHGRQQASDLLNATGLHPSTFGYGASIFRPKPSIESDEQSSRPTQVHNNERILLTGGGGNIGKKIIRVLLDLSYSITVVDTIFFEHELNTIYAEVPQAKERLTVHIGDIRDERLIKSTLTPDVVGVINLAAVSRVLWCLENGPDCEDVNVRGTDLILQQLSNQYSDRPSLPWFIQASSREVYGSADVALVTEDTPRIPANVYGSSKLRAEEVIERFVSTLSQTQGSPAFHSIALRLSNVYGGEFDHRERLIPSIMTQAIAHRTIQIVGGHQDLDMIHIDDVVRAFGLAMHRLNEKEVSDAALHSGTGRSIEAFNVASGVSVMSLDLVRKILWLTNSSSPLQVIPSDNRFPDKYVGSTVKAASVLGFQAQVSIDDGLRKLYKAYLEQTAAYLNDRINTGCASQANIAQEFSRLNGCSGTVVANASGRALHLGKAMESNIATGDWEWQESINPDTFQFQVEITGETNRFTLRLKYMDSSDAETYVEVESEQLGDSINQFDAVLDPTDASLGTIAIQLQSGETSWAAPHTGKYHLSLGDTTHSFRLIPSCCPDLPSPWPFYSEDPLASAIFESRTESGPGFANSHKDRQCSRLKGAQAYAERKLEMLALTEEEALEKATLPTGLPSEWRSRGLPTCSNLCDHPTTCVDTGDCACVQSSCPPLPRFPFSAFANLPVLSYPGFSSSDEGQADPLSLVKQVNRSSWLNVLRSPASRYLGRQPELPEIHVIRTEGEVSAGAASNGLSCNTDQILETSLGHISTERTKDSFVFLPPHGTSLDDERRDGVQKMLHADASPSQVIVTNTNQWGLCKVSTADVFEVRAKGEVASEWKDSIGWSFMGDLNTECYRYDQDVVIPPRSCDTPSLLEMYGDIHHVRPVRQRSVLAAFSGPNEGAGASIRQKLTCKRSSQSASPALQGAETMPVLWASLSSGKNTLNSLNDTVFCPLPYGVTGWSTHTENAIYAGCIPVLISDVTQHPFWDILDWAKFSVTVDVDDLDHLEHILRSYTWTQLESLQTNLMLIRDAFVYPAESESTIPERSPLFFALHSAALLRYTRYPTR